MSWLVPRRVRFFSVSCVVLGVVGVVCGMGERAAPSVSVDCTVAVGFDHMIVFLCRQACEEDGG